MEKVQKCEVQEQIWLLVYFSVYLELQLLITLLPFTAICSTCFRQIGHLQVYKPVLQYGTYKTISTDTVSIFIRLVLCCSQTYDGRLTSGVHLMQQTNPANPATRWNGITCGE
jgi:hypothetical protein